ncbi:MAG: phosphoribosyl-ATP diphosphatase, partial [Parvularculaceae bacterium]
DLGEVLNRLMATIESRRGADPAQSYTATLFSGGVDGCARKFGEEAIEAVVAGVAGDKGALIQEAADALYHLLVLLAVANISAAEVAAVLKRREKKSGHAEKGSRRRSD